MARSPYDLTVFVSSTSKDLEDYRAVSRHVILDMQWRPMMMEHFTAQPGNTVASCCQMVGECDVLLVIVAWRQGWVPSIEQGGNGEDSITAFEIRYARERHIPVLVLFAGPAWPGYLWEDDAEKRNWIKHFREEMNQIAGTFEYEAPGSRDSERLPAFRALVKQTLLAHKERLLAAIGPTPPALDFFASARDGLLEGKDIPVVGSGIFGTGPLSSDAIVKALLQPRDGVSEGIAKARLPLATAAEYRERFDGSREQFLSRVRTILQRQTSEAATPRVVQLLAQLPTIRLIVSATFDSSLESELDRLGRPYVTVAHVVRSFEGEMNGRLLVRRKGAAPEFCRADELRLTADECAVYKPQGSPFLHDGLDPDLEIDTVVITETDHAIFLQRLESLETGVPAPVRSRFRRSPLLFLGYTMDVWQYRLMMLVFQSAHRDDGRAWTRAVRIPGTEVEEVAWNRLNTSVIRMDPNEFAQSALSAAGL
jgi:hypothetical protein